MPEPRWLLESAVRAIHFRQIAEHGGDDGVRDPGLLQSALNRPRNRWAYSSSKPGLAELAACYAFGIAKNHPFVDGNKRTAFVACRTFLLINGEDMDATPEEKYVTFLGVAEGTVSEAKLAKWIAARRKRKRRRR